MIATVNMNRDGIVRISEEYLHCLNNLGEMFYSQEGVPGKFDLKEFTNTWTTFIKHGIGDIFCLVRDGYVIGIIGGVLYRDPNDGEFVATEFFWYVHPSHRGSGIRLVKVFEEWARAKGAKRSTMMHLFNKQFDQLNKLYTRLGYTATEVHYTKEL